MGVPALFRWLSQKYPKIISAVHEEKPKEIDGEEIPIDITQPNPNGEEMHNLYLDMNNIVHNCSHPDDRPPPATEEEMMLETFKYTERLFNMVRPRRLLMIAVDGVAPRAKMNQQRARRFRSVQEAKEKNDEKAEFVTLLKQQNGGILDENVEAEMNKQTWDHNVITPGTPFMDLLAASLRYWCAYKLNTDPAWEAVKIIISDATVPGEGEHKIMEFIRSQRSSPEHDPNTRHVIYGLDADLIMLGLATHEPHFRVLRDDVFFQESKGRTCHICGQAGHLAAECRGDPKKKQGEFDEKGKIPSQKPFIWLHVSILREYLAIEMDVPNPGFKFDLERAIDDWIFMCFFVGNDFLPHLPSLDIREQGIDTLIAIWRDKIPLMGGYVTKDGHVDLERVQLILAGLAKQEDAIFKRRRETEERKDANAKRRQVEDSHRAPKRPRYSTGSDMPANGSGLGLVSLGMLKDQRGFNNNSGLLALHGNQSEPLNNITFDTADQRNVTQNANLANKSAAVALKEKLMGRKSTGSQKDSNKSHVNDDSNYADVSNSLISSSVLGKRKADLIEQDGTSILGSESPGPVSRPKIMSDGDEPPPDDVKLWEEGYGDRYYEQKFHVSPSDQAFRHKVGRAYVEGLAWVLLYYFQGCPSWTWYYPYHYAPFAADFVDISSMKISFEKGTIFKPYEQLMSVLPAGSNHAIPEVFHSLMTDENSDIIDFYPETFPIDLNGKKFAWQGVALLPFIDEKRLLKAVSDRYPLLSDAEKRRNEPGHDALLFSDRHPLYEGIATNFYSKKKGAPKYILNPRISEGLAGKVEKNDEYHPQSSLIFPGVSGLMPNLEEDHCMTVHYKMPESIYVHKSMILRGVDYPLAALDQQDRDITRSKTSHSGRSHGGVPFDGNRGRRGGRGGGAASRGGQISYADSHSINSRPNPFAKHLNPNFFTNGGDSRPPVPGWGGPPPPPNGTFGRGGMSAMPMPRGNFGYGAPPEARYQTRSQPARDPRYQRGGYLQNSNGRY